jgi:two-component system cell cycle sensor histidine kinase/response regulator CckA
MEMIETAMREGFHRFEWTHKRVDGEEFIADVLLTRMEYAGRQFLQATVRDITERKQAEELLRLSQERYRNLINNQGEGVGITDLDERFIYVNPAASDILGIPIDELLGMRLDDLVSPQDLPILRDQSQKRKLNERASYEMRVIRPDGAEICLLVTATPQLDEKGNVTGSFGVFRDITARKQTEELLREQEFKLRSITDTAQDAILMMDDSGAITFWNPAAERIFGYTTQEAIGRDLHALIAPSQYHDAFQEAYTEFLKTGKGNAIGKTIELKGLRKDGKEIDVEVSLAPILVKDKWHAAGVVRDISARKSLEEQFHQAMKMETVGRLAGGVAHDFNNLLTVISGYSDMMLNQLEKNDPLYSNVQEIQNASDRAANLTRQLLAFSRKQILEPQVINLNSILTDLNKMLRRIIGEDIDLITVPNPDLWNIEADPGQVEQVIVNLSVNSRDAMPGGGKLTTETQNVHLDEEYCQVHPGVIAGDYAMLAVSDNGSGMSQEIMSKIFEPFFTTKEAGKGTGLGLATVYGIVKQSGGYVNVYSEIGTGTSFKVYFPKKDKEADAVVRHARPLDFEEVRGIETILIVEDEEVVREMAAKVLKKNGYKVIAAVTGGDALLQCQKMKEPVDMVLTDVIMPGISGPEFADELRKLWPDIKVLFMSGYTADAIMNQKTLEPGTPFIGKPFRMAELLKKVRDVLTSSKAPIVS